MERLAIAVHVVQARDRGVREEAIREAGLDVVLHGGGRCGSRLESLDEPGIGGVGGALVRFDHAAEARSGAEWEDEKERGDIFCERWMMYQVRMQEPRRRSELTWTCSRPDARIAPPGPTPAHWLLDANWTITADPVHLLLYK